MTYFDYWSNKTMETQYSHYAAKHGAIVATMSLRLNFKKLNDGAYYNLGGWTMWKDPLRPHGKLRFWP